MSGPATYRRQFIEPFLRSRFTRNVATVATGTAAAQGLNVAFAPLITRIYGPEAFGLLGTFLAMVAVATPVATLAYPVAVVLPRADRDALGLVRLSIFSSIGVGIVATVALWFGKDWLAAMVGAGAVTGYMLLIPVAMLFSAWVKIGEQWLIRKGEFSVIARIAVAQSFIMNSAKTGIGWLNPVATVLIVLSTLGPSLHAALLFFGARRRYRDASRVKKKASSVSLGELAYLHRDFPLYRAPQIFINTISQSLPVLLLAAFFSPIAAGFYTLGKMVMGLPSSLVGKAISDVFYPRITEAAHRGENIAGLILRATAGLLAIGLVPFGLVIFFGPWLFEVVFGTEWVVAGQYARWLALFFLFNFINKPSVAAVPVLGIQRGLLVYEVFSTGGKVVGMLLGVFWLADDVWAVALFSIIGVIAYSIMMLWIITRAVRWKANAETGR